MQYFYSPDANIGNILELDREESRHLIRSLRKKLNDKVHITNGKGEVFEATIVDDNMNSCILNITNLVEAKFQTNYELHIAISPLKSQDRFEWFVEKASEIGISSITPIKCVRSEKTNIKIERLERIALSAMKQSLKTKLPTINELTDFEEFISAQTDDFSKFIAWCETDKEELFSNMEIGKKTLILIGPEGDFTNEEVEMAVKKGFKPISLGQSRFRTETAAVLACHTVFLANQ